MPWTQSDKTLFLSDTSWEPLPPCFSHLLFIYIFYLLIFYKIVLEPEERERNADCSKDYLLGAFKVYANMKGKLLSIEEFKISQNSVVTVYEFPLKGPK